MGFSNQFFKAVGIFSEKKDGVLAFARKSGVPQARLRYYNDRNILPSGGDLENILSVAGISEVELKLKMGRFDKDIIEAIQLKSGEISQIVNGIGQRKEDKKRISSPKFETNLGKLFHEDCCALLSSIESDYFDLIFADPPFNLDKLYPSQMNDNIKTESYIHWCQDWLAECIRTLKPGGSLFLWNLPKWNAALTNFLDGRLNFKHWIAVDIKYSLPIKGRLYPSHYSLLYYVKGDKANVFHPDRLPMQTCPKCFGDLKDYGGYKDKMNPLGVNISDIWTDIPPVRHAKYKRREGANELSLKLLDRIIEMATDKGQIIFDPFGGSGTTYMAAELKGRKWVGCEIGPINDIIERFALIEEERTILNGYREQLNTLFTNRVKKKREALGLWTCESVRKK